MKIIKGESDMVKKLYRSKNNKIIAGVAGGIGEYFQIDPSLVRIIFILSGIFMAGIIVYIIAAVIIPSEDSTIGQQYQPDENEWGSGSFTDNEARGYDRSDSPDKSRLVIGIALILFGVIFLAKQIFPYFHFNFFWPLLIIVIGLFFIFKNRG
jgi:phage shock protein C